MHFAPEVTETTEDIRIQKANGIPKTEGRGVILLDTLFSFFAFYISVPSVISVAKRE
jgi:hypothetical protein